MNYFRLYRHIIARRGLLVATTVCITSFLVQANSASSEEKSHWNRILKSFSTTKRVFCQRSTSNNLGGSLSNSIKMTTNKMPVYFISHGGPTSAVESETKHFKFFQDWGNQVRDLSPKAMVIFSAHWESEKVAVRTTESNHLLYDFYGFPDELYKLQYNSRGSEQLAKRIIELLNKVGIPTTTETKRGLDHGIWVPLYVALNNPSFPIIQVSLVSTRGKPDAQCFEENYQLGVALQSLRDDGVLIVGSGSSTHNLRELWEYMRRGVTPEYTHEFENNLEKIVILPSDERKESAIKGLAKLTCLHKAHPSLEHLVPFHVALGAAGDDPCKKIFDDRVGSVANSAFIYAKTS